MCSKFEIGEVGNQSCSNIEWLQRIDADVGSPSAQQDKPSSPTCLSLFQAPVKCRCQSQTRVFLSIIPKPKFVFFNFITTRSKCLNH